MRNWGSVFDIFAQTMTFQKWNWLKYTWSCNVLLYSFLSKYLCVQHNLSTYNFFWSSLYSIVKGYNSSFGHIYFSKKTFSASFHFWWFHNNMIKFIGIRNHRFFAHNQSCAWKIHGEHTIACFPKRIIMLKTYLIIHCVQKVLLFLYFMK